MKGFSGPSARHIQVWQIIMTKSGAVQPLCRFGDEGANAWRSETTFC